MSGKLINAADTPLAMLLKFIKKHRLHHGAVAVGGVVLVSAYLDWSFWPFIASGLFLPFVFSDNQLPCYRGGHPDGFDFDEYRFQMIATLYKDFEYLSEEQLKLLSLDERLEYQELMDRHIQEMNHTIKRTTGDVGALLLGGIVGFIHD